MFLLVKKGLGYITTTTARGWIGINLIETLIVVPGVYVAAGLGRLQEGAQERRRLDLIVAAFAEIRLILDIPLLDVSAADN